MTSYLGHNIPNEANAPHTGAQCMYLMPRYSPHSPGIRGEATITGALFHDPCNFFRLNSQKCHAIFFSSTDVENNLAYFWENMWKIILGISVAK